MSLSQINLEVLIEMRKKENGNASKVVQLLYGMHSPSTEASERCREMILAAAAAMEDDAGGDARARYDTARKCFDEALAEQRKQAEQREQASEGGDGPLVSDDEEEEPDAQVAQRKEEGEEAGEEEAEVLDVEEDESGGSVVGSELSLQGLDKYRVKGGLDTWVIPPEEAANLLGVSVQDQQQAWKEVSAYPMRRKGDAIVAGEVQWVNGDNEALQLYRQGTRLNRNKMWFQTDDPLKEGFLVYKYPYHQKLVVPATFDVAQCPPLAKITEAYNSRICKPLGAKEANHGIATSYEDGADCIDPHSDDASTLASSDADGLSLIGVLKMGENARLFEIAMDKDSKPFFSKVLPPGTLILMTVGANNRTVHSVPAVSNCGPSGSFAWRTVVERLPMEQLAKKLHDRAPGGKKQLEQAKAQAKAKKPVDRSAAVAAYKVAADAIDDILANKGR